MDNSIEGYKSGANAASAELSTLQSSAPSMLADLKKNLVGIFAKDNPLIAARETALSDYLSSANNTRASILPNNLPVVEGSNLTLSPTQQDAIVGARQNAALAPLFGLNQLVTGQYGTIGDIIQGAGTAYGASIDAAKTRVANLIDLYKTAVAEKEAATKAAAGGGGFDLAGIIAAIRGAMGTGTPTRPPIDAFDEPDELVLNDPITGQPTKLNLNVPAIPQPATSGSQPINFGSSGLNLGNYNLSNFSLNKPATTGLSIAGAPQKDLFAGLGIKLGGSNGYGF